MLKVLPDCSPIASRLDLSRRLFVDAGPLARIPPKPAHMVRSVLLVGVALLASLRADAAQPTGVDSAPSFVNDVIPVLTKAGCNAGACHGAQHGKGGFKLSLLGYDPDLDYASMTHDLL